jgi:putative flippase GtrA
VSDVFWTAALNCWVSFVNTLALLGVMLIATGGVTVTATLADFVVSAALVAVTAWDPAFAGAV